MLNMRGTQKSKTPPNTRTPSVAEVFEKAGSFPVIVSRRFPDLARKYLSAPCTSTDSERLFSAAAHVLYVKRNRLHCDKAEMLLFIKKNLTLYRKK
ncbi:hypothetical protein C0J45_9180 [Silurus meridionalis]|nr:hypothetical protein C0J45_9180 [Silurus meridionalis]